MDIPEFNNPTMDEVPTSFSELCARIDKLKADYMADRITKAEFDALFASIKADGDILLAKVDELREEVRKKEEQIRELDQKIAVTKAVNAALKRYLNRKQSVSQP